MYPIWNGPEIYKNRAYWLGRFEDMSNRTHWSPFWRPSMYLHGVQFTSSNYLNALLLVNRFRYRKQRQLRFSRVDCLRLYKRKLLEAYCSFFDQRWATINSKCFYNKSVFSLLRRLSTWRCSHLLLSAAPLLLNAGACCTVLAERSQQARCAAIDRHLLLSSKPTGRCCCCRSMGQTDGQTGGRLDVS